MLIPVLMYHDIKDDDFDLSTAAPKDRPYIQTISQFTDQAVYFKRQGFKTVLVRELAEYNEARKGVSITFDDGDLSNFTVAFKALAQRGLRATFFITTDFIGKPGRVTWEHLREMHAAGMEIGSHTVTHPYPSELTDTQLYYELSQSKVILEDGLNAKVNSFSMPTGFYNANVKRMASQCGYDYVCTSFAGVYNTDKKNNYNVKRLAVKRTTGQRVFQAYAECKAGYIYGKQLIEKIKGSGKNILGVDVYNALRDKVLKERRK